MAQDLKRVVASIFFGVLLLSRIALAADTPAPGPKRLKLTFLGVTAGAGVSDSEAQTVSHTLQSEITNTGIYDVIGIQEMQTLLGVQRQKQIAGCADDQSSSCLEEMAGALNADRAISGDLSRAGHSLLLNVSLINLKTGKVINRVGRQLDSTDSVEPVLDVLRPVTYSMVNTDPVLAGRVVVAPRGFGGPMLGVRADADVLGLGVSPAITGEYGGKHFGVSATILIKAVPGLRVEGRYFPFTLGRFRPYAAVGATGFSTGIGPRAALGAQVQFGQVVAFGDFAYEHFFNADPSRFQVNALLIGLGAGWLF